MKWLKRAWAYIKHLFSDAEAQPAPQPVSQPVILDAVINRQTKFHPGHYVQITSEADFLNYVENMPAHFIGLFVGLSWADIEKDEGVYDFTLIDRVMTLATQYKRFIILQINDRSHDGTLPCPQYIADQFGVVTVTEPSHGIYSRIWDVAVMYKFNLMLQAVGQRYDSLEYLEGINFAESSVHFAQQEDPTFNYDQYELNLKSRITTGLNAFPTSLVIQSVNWMPEDKIGSFIGWMDSVGCALGGPDVIPQSTTDACSGSQTNRPRSYDYYPTFAGPKCTQVQGTIFRYNVCGIVSIPDVYTTAVDILGATHVPWMTIEGSQFCASFTNDIVPYVQLQQGRI